jgi:Protein of unknown function (DUF3306)
VSQDDGFLARWSRRKAQIKGGAAPLPDPTPAASPTADLPAALSPEVPASAAPSPEVPAPVAPSPAPETPVAPPLPTLDDVALLTRESDYSRFVAPGVDANVRNAAMKKLFSDPHFNVMDGLDTYIDDYGKPDPIPPAMLRQMTQARWLGLFSDDDAGKDKASPDGAAAQQLPQSQSCPAASASASPTVSPPASPPTSPDEDPDLRLQQDDAAGPASAEPRSGPASG